MGAQELGSKDMLNGILIYAGTSVLWFLWRELRGNPFQSANLPCILLKGFSPNVVLVLEIFPHERNHEHSLEAESRSSEWENEMMILQDAGYHSFEKDRGQEVQERV